MKMNVETITEVINALVGDIMPVGSTHIDDARYENLIKMEEVIDCLMVGMWRVYYEYSITRASDEACRYLKEKKEAIESWVEEYDGLYH